MQTQLEESAMQTKQEETNMQTKQEETTKQTKLEERESAIQTKLEETTVQTKLEESISHMEEGAARGYGHDGVDEPGPAPEGEGPPGEHLEAGAGGPEKEAGDRD